MNFLLEELIWQLSPCFDNCCLISLHVYKSVAKLLVPTTFANWFHALVIMLTWVFYSVNLIFWELRYSEPLQAYDPVAHFFDSVVIAKAILTPWGLFHLSDITWELAAYDPVTAASRMYFAVCCFPPFVYYVTAFIFLLGRILHFSPSMQLAILTNIPFILILLISTYGLGRELVSPRAGVVAAILTSGYQAAVIMTRVYLLDFPITAMVALTLFLLVRSHWFRNTRTVILLSLAMLAGMLTKTSFPIYVGGPLLYGLIRGRSILGLRNALIAGGIAALSAIWYIQSNILQYYQYAFQIPGGLQAAHVRGFIIPFSVYGVMLYQLIHPGIGFLQLLLFIVGVSYVLLKLSGSRMFVAIGLLTPFLLLGVINPLYPDPRYLMPLFALVGVASSSILKAMNGHRRIQLTAAICIVAIVFAQYSAITYVTVANPKILTLNVRDTQYGLYGGLYLNAVDNEPQVGKSPETLQGWRTVILDILHGITKDAANRQISQPAAIVLVTSEASTGYFEASLFMYYAYVENLNVRFNLELQIGATSPDSLIKATCSVDYLVIKQHAGLDTGDRITYFTDSAVLATDSFIEAHPDSFQKIAVYPLPDWYGPKNATLYWHSRGSCPTLGSSLSQQGSFYSPKVVREGNSNVRQNLSVTLPLLTVLVQVNRLK